MIAAGLPLGKRDGIWSSGRSAVLVLYSCCTRAVMYLIHAPPSSSSSIMRGNGKGNLEKGGHLNTKQRSVDPKKTPPDLNLEQFDQFDFGLKYCNCRLNLEVSFPHMDFAYEGQEEEGK